MPTPQDAIMIHMVDHGAIEGAKLTMKGYIVGHIIKARCALAEKRTLNPTDIDAIIGWLKIAEESIQFLSDEEGENDGA